MVPENLFYEISILLVLSGVLGAVAWKLRQPLIVAYIAVGVAAGPVGLGWVRVGNEVDLLARIGITVLLFLVGLRLDLHIIRTLGVVALATGLGQVVFTSVVGFLLCIAMDMDLVTSLYVAVALTFSSTIIIVKLLSDKREVDALHGRIAVGMLIVQDVVVIVAMVGLTALDLSGEQGVALQAATVVGKGVAFLAGVTALARWVIPRVLGAMARSQELLMLSATAWAVFLAALGEYLGFSKEVGAFLAGVSLASTTYREAIGARLTSLRDFLLPFFFINLGAHLNINSLGSHVGTGAVLSLFVLVGNPLVVVAIMGVMGYRKRTGFLTGLTVAQISEFSLVLGALGVQLGHIGRGALDLITLVGLVTIGLSTYMILYSHRLYDWLAPVLSPFERQTVHREDQVEAAASSARQLDALVFGGGRYGGQIAAELARRGLAVLVIDFDPRAVASLREKGIPAEYGDAEDGEFLAALPLGSTRWIVCATSQRSTNLGLARYLKASSFSGCLALTAHSDRDAESFEAVGADVVLLPFRDAAVEAAHLVVTAPQRPSTT